MLHWGHIKEWKQKFPFGIVWWRVSLNFYPQCLSLSSLCLRCVVTSWSVSLVCYMSHLSLIALVTVYCNEETPWWRQRVEAVFNWVIANGSREHGSTQAGMTPEKKLSAYISHITFIYTLKFLIDLSWVTHFLCFVFYPQLSVFELIHSVG